MAEYLVDLTPRSDYVDRKLCLRSLTAETDFVKSRQKDLNVTRTVYVGNLSFYTTESQIESHFSACGDIERIVMGLGAQSKAPCGFCFVVFETFESALAAVQDLHKTLLDDSTISVTWDAGLVDDSRRWGRGVNGQVIDAKRPTNDDRRGGLGGMRQEANGIAPTILEDALVTYTWVPAYRPVNFKHQPKPRDGAPFHNNKRPRDA
ncbi:nuclear cap binding protein, putative [Bodo saltans]|uniref:Nuclear cap-binding protein subunit 2 n=2 Tax=Bodo saltans TaxID=75058 RepID=A0A0S4INS3_BODSA|nr:nuclear cap binding protein, putative [Bodo saltans]|eukprot:CUE67529.1 nuclear cap binding protein, putative [Bodo saltans]